MSKIYIKMMTDRAYEHLKRNLGVIANKIKDNDDVVDYYGLTDPSQTNFTDNLTEYLKPNDDTNEPTYTVKKEDNALPDLRYAAKTGCTRENTGSIVQLPFKHILSKVNFEILQQEDPDNAGGGRYGDLTLEMIVVLDQPTQGTFNIKQGVFTSLSAGTETYTVDMEPVDIGIEASKAGSILLFPMIGDPATPMQITITLGSTSEKNLKPFNTQIQTSDGKYTLDITCNVYATGSTTSQQPLRLQPNYEYTLQLAIMGNDVRIVTVIPKVYEWLDGETDSMDEDGYYEEQLIGQPVTFNGVMWSDRNLGASSPNPLASIDDWRKSVGYYYQYDRNIPYFPNTYDEATRKVDLNTPLEVALKEEYVKSSDEHDGYPGIDFEGKKRKVYPVVNYEAWGVTYPNIEQMRPRYNTTDENKDYVYVKQIGILPPKADDKEYTWGMAITHMGGAEEGIWQNVETQPCPKGWRLPTKEDFMGIFPSSPHAGNFSFLVLDKVTKPLYGPNKYNDDFATVFAPGGAGLTQVHSDLTTMTDKEGNQVAYFGSFPCIYREEQNDPDPGSKSCYLLSMYENDDEDIHDWTRALDGALKLRENANYVYSWGVCYGIKHQGTSKAYRVKWEIKMVGDAETITITSGTHKGKTGIKYKEGFYGVLVISRYSASKTDDFQPDENGSYEWIVKKKDWWAKPAEVLYLPLCGLVGRWDGGHLYYIGSESRYGTSTPNGKNTRWIANIKIAGNGTSSQLVTMTGNHDRWDGTSIRPVRDLP